MTPLRLRVRSRDGHWTDHQDGTKEPAQFGSLTAARWVARHLLIDDDQQFVLILSGSLVVEQWGVAAATE